MTFYLGLAFIGVGIFLSGVFVGWLVGAERADQHWEESWAPRELQPPPRPGAIPGEGEMVAAILDEEEG